MKRIKSIFTVFAVFALVATSNFAFASENVNWDVSPSAKALSAAASASYDQAYLKAVNSDAGIDIIPSAKALAAAEGYKYDQKKLALVSNDAADAYYFPSEHQSI